MVARQRQGAEGAALRPERYERAPPRIPEARSARLRSFDRSAVKRAFLGIDCGTQSTKVVLVDATSLQPRVIGHEPHQLIERDDGTREQEPDEWVKALVDRKSTRLNSSHLVISYAVFCLKKKNGNC